MYYQKYPGIYVYFKTRKYGEYENSFELAIKDYYSTLEHFFWLNKEYDIRNNISYSIHDKKCCHITGCEYRRTWWKAGFIKHERLCNKINCYEHDNKGTDMFVVYDENGKQYTPDVLIGLRRDWLNNKRVSKVYYNRYRSKSNGKKKQTYGRYRHMKTFQERKWAHAWDDEEFAPKTRIARTNLHLPSSWDTYHRHCDKNWKTQSKRKHQWREK